MRGPTGSEAAFAGCACRWHCLVVVVVVVVVVGRPY
jgi:hypothetical protein